MNNCSGNQIEPLCQFVQLTDEAFLHREQFLGALICILSEHITEWNVIHTKQKFTAENAACILFAPRLIFYLSFLNHNTHMPMHIRTMADDLIVNDCSRCPMVKYVQTTLR